MRRFVPLVMAAFLGCGTVQQTGGPIEPPELIKMTSLPTISSSISWAGLKLVLMLHVMKDGTVGEVRMVESSGMPEWDTLAIQSIKQWQFLPGRYEGEVADLWIRQPIVVKPREATTLTLGEIVCGTQDEADSIHGRLDRGEEFESLASRYSIAPSRAQGGFLGTVDIAIYPQHVRNELRRLRQGEYTSPLRVGDRYYIYRRYRGTIP
jgi:TonB family protein